MVEEMERIKQEGRNYNVEKISDNIEVKEQSDSTSFNIDKLNEQGKSGALFWGQLLICSLLIWSLLFIKQSIYSKECISSITQVLTKNIEIEPIQRVVNELTVAIKQIL